MKVSQSIEFIFEDDIECKKMLNDFKKAYKKEWFCLEPSIDRFLGETKSSDDTAAGAERDCYIEAELNSRQKNRLSIFCKSERPIEDTVRIAKKLGKMGAKLVRLLEVRGNGLGSEAYVVNGKIVTKDIYEQKKFPDLKNYPDDLFLPDGRTVVEVKLKKQCSESSGGYIQRFDFEMERSKKCVFRGILEYRERHVLSIVEGENTKFIASFHLEKLKGKFVSLVHAPRKV